MNRAYGKRDTGSWIEDTGFVRRLLSDDNNGSRHQRLILDLRGLVHWTHDDPQGVEDGGHIRYRTRTYS